MVTAVDNTGKIQSRVEKFIGTFYTTDVIANDYETRRNAPRFPMTESVDVMLDSDRTPAEVILATGRDISVGGIGLYSHRPIPTGTEMIINIDNGRERLLTKAVAVHSTMSVGLFKVGARFII